VAYRRWGGAGALLVASIVVGVIEDDHEFEPGSPEAAVQAFLRAVDSEDLESAYGLLSDALREQCSLEDFAGGPRRLIRDFGNQRLVLENTSTVGDTVYVDVSVTEFQGGDLFGSHYSFEQRYALRLSDGQWWFTQYPWPFFPCGPFKPAPAEPERPAPAAAVPTPESS